MTFAVKRNQKNSQSIFEKKKVWEKRHKVLQPHNLAWCETENSPDEQWKKSNFFGRSFPELTVILFFVGKLAPCSTVILSIIRRLLEDNLWRLKSLNKIPQNLQTIAVADVLQDCQRSSVTKDERKLYKIRDLWVFASSSSSCKTGVFKSRRRKEAFDWYAVSITAEYWQMLQNQSFH